MIGEASRRERFVEAIRARMEREEMPRLTILGALLLAGALAFLTSMLLLGAGLVSMPARYPLAGLAGYLAFIVAIQIWIVIRRGSIKAEEISDTLRSADLADVPPMHAGPGSPWRRGLLDALDLDDAWWVVLALMLLFMSVTAIVYVVYIAPLLLAEIALDAALVSTLYRRLRAEERGHWVGALVRHTWKPALLLVVGLAVAGYAMQLIAPGAHSIGDVFGVFL